MLPSVPPAGQNVLGPQSCRVGILAGPWPMSQKATNLPTQHFHPGCVTWLLQNWRDCTILIRTHGPYNCFLSPGVRLLVHLPASLQVAIRDGVTRQVVTSAYAQVVSSSCR